VANMNGTDPQASQPEETAPVMAWCGPLGAGLTGVGLVVGFVGWLVWMAGGESEFRYIPMAILGLAALLLLPGIGLLLVYAYVRRAIILSSLAKPRVIIALLVTLMAVAALGYGFQRWCWAQSERRIEPLPELRGKTLAQIVQEKGNPDQTATFTMADAIRGNWTLHRAELFRTYPSGQPANAGISILEYEWRSGERIVTVWFHRQPTGWVVVDACRRHSTP
jgi:hypothetical protein